ncbi:MAG: hypothetical protein ACOVS5_14585, partial [Oligoflexus sp.]
MYGSLETIPSDFDDLTYVLKKASSGFLFFGKTLLQLASSTDVSDREHDLVSPVSIFLLDRNPIESVDAVSTVERE